MKHCGLGQTWSSKTLAGLFAPSAAGRNLRRKLKNSLSPINPRQAERGQRDLHQEGVAEFHDGSGVKLDPATALN